jgi:hypothetical protein
MRQFFAEFGEIDENSIDRNRSVAATPFITAMDRAHVAAVD